jgi:Ca2+-binding RTX toxin-like protein
MCDQDSRNYVTNTFWANKLGISTTHFDALSSGSAVSDPLAPAAVTGFVSDEAGNSIGAAPGNPTITIGQTILATLQTVGDEDFFQVTLEAGKAYQIGQYAAIGGPGGVPLADAYFEIYDAAGNLVLSVDGGGPNTPSGLDALSTFTPEASGTYYINARAFDQDGTNGTTGDAVGDYELFVKEAPPGAPVYTPFYDTDSPLHSLDWGSEFKRSSRNPDSDNGTRSDNGVTQQDNLLDARSGIEGKNVIRVYFAKQGEVFLSSDPTTPGVTADMVQAIPITDMEKDAYRLAFQQYENVADLVYLEVDNRNEADLVIITYKGTPGPGASLLGRASPPGEESEGQMEFNAGDERYNEAGLTQGGFFFTTLLHEFGHAHGMSHPHDNGGRSSIMRGAGGGTGGIGGAYGDFGLSQGVFTVMSYNDGWDLRPDGTPKPDDAANNGWVGTLSPLDIAVIQDKYGVNEEFRKGNDTYVLKDTQEKGTFYAAIWDAGGTDEIVYSGARNATVDLRPATLKYEEGGGGRVSYVTGINGGFTIANGATIENVRTDAGNDTVTGNDAANRLETGAGNDVVNGGGGDDVIVAGAGFDTITGGAGADRFVFTSAGDSFSATDPTQFDRISDFEQGVDKIDLDALDGIFVGTANFSGRAGELRYGSFGGDTLIQLDADGDGDADFNLMLTGNRVLTIDDFIGVVPPNLRLVGTSGNDNLVGGVGDDTLIGLAGNDTLNGAGGSDTADYSGLADNTRIDLDIATAQVVGKGGGSDTLISIENLIGGAGANTFYGTAGNNRLDGGAGADVLDGRGGNDVLIGGRGADQVAGRAGSDIFQFNGLDEVGLGRPGDAKSYDRIVDFTRGADKIDLSRIDAVAGGGDDAFSFIGSNGFSNKAGELRYSTSSIGTVLAGDVNGDGVADFEILLVNKAIPTVTDFLL